ncbi:hypothetical protein C0992_002010, partial [Termitomyces sp. T32_za158]
VVDVEAEILLKGLIHSFGLAIGFRVVSGRESNLDVERLAERGPELGDEEGAAVGDDIVWEPVFGEYVFEEEFGELRG